MPRKPPRPCAQHPWLLVADGDGCPECAKQAGRPSLKSTLEDARPSAARRGYGVVHKKKRGDLIKRLKWCEDPYHRHPHVRVLGTVRDHVVPLRQGGTDDKSNEQLLCNSCHNYKTAHDGSRTRGRGD